MFCLQDFFLGETDGKLMKLFNFLPQLMMSRLQIVAYKDHLCYL